MLLVFILWIFSTSLSASTRSWHFEEALRTESGGIPSWITRPQDLGTYTRFVRGKLIYTDPKSNERIELPFRDLANPLEGEFDLSRCEGSGQYLSINTGYRKRKRPENENKLEMWIAPRFLIEKELTSSAKHFQPIMGEWDPSAAPVGLFWTWGGWNDMGRYDYLTHDCLERVSNGNLYEKWRVSVPLLGDSGHHGLISEAAVRRARALLPGWRRMLYDAHRTAMGKTPIMFPAAPCSCFIYELK